MGGIGGSERRLSWALQDHAEGGYFLFFRLGRGQGLSVWNGHGDGVYIRKEGAEGGILHVSFRLFFLFL